MKALILVGTLQKAEAADQNSRTLKLSRRFAEALATKEVDVDLLRLADFDLPNDKGQSPWSGPKKELLDRILAADILILATPIWWNNHSSLIQRVIEILDDQNDLDYSEEGYELGGRIRALAKTSFDGKVAGAIVVGTEDGTQHVTGGLLMPLMWMGYTIPPMCAVTMTQTPDEWVKQMIEVASHNLASYAAILKEKA